MPLASRCVISIGTITPSGTPPGQRADSGVTNLRAENRGGRSSRSAGFKSPWFGAVHRPTAATRLWLPSPKSGGAEAHRFLVRLRDLQSLIRPGAPVQESATIVPPPRPRVALWPPAVARCARWWKFVGDTKTSYESTAKALPLA